MNLDQKKCVPCQAGSSKLPMVEAREMLENLASWSLNDDATKLLKSYKFKNFVESIEFVNKIGEIAEAENHHPDIYFGYGYVNIEIQTHKINGLHENDFILAAKIDAC